MVVTDMHEEDHLYILAEVKAEREYEIRKHKRKIASLDEQIKQIKADIAEIQQTERSEW